MSKTDQDLVTEVRALLDGSTEQIDSRIDMRLRRIRREAVELADRRKPALARWVLGGSLAAAAAAAALFMWTGTPRESVVAKAGDDVEIVASPERLDICEDLEFYRWLAQRDAQGG